MWLGQPKNQPRIFAAFGTKFSESWSKPPSWIGWSHHLQTATMTPYLAPSPRAQATLTWTSLQHSFMKAYCIRLSTNPGSSLRSSTGS